jgi:2-phosphosulfolactate phosphatase
MDNRPTVEVIFSPELYKFYVNPDAIVVVVDIFRATSAICTAFKNGVSTIIPVPTLDEARQYKGKGCLVAAERDGEVPEFADFGNSPFNFSADKIKDREVAYSTTNGAKTIRMAAKGSMVLIASYINISAVYSYLCREKKDVQILCAGWKGKFCLEDTVFAGALGDKLIASEIFHSDCDSLKASLDLWNAAKDDLIGYIDKSMQRKRLRRLGIDDILEYSHTPDSSERIPVFKNGVIMDLARMD